MGPLRWVPVALREIERVVAAGGGKQAAHSAPGGERLNPCGPLGNREPQGAVVFSVGTGKALPPNSAAGT